VRIFGTPGTAGAYADRPNTKAGAIEAEKRAIAATLNRKEVANPTTMTRKSEPEAPSTTIKEHAKTFLEMYKPDQKPSERRAKKQILDGHLLPFFGDMAIERVKQTDVDAFATKELARKCSVKTVNNRLAVLSSLIRYSTGEKPRLRLHLDGMLGELAALPMPDVEKLIDAATDARFRVVVLLAAEAGLRAGEIRGLQWGDVRNGMLTVRRSLDNATNEAYTAEAQQVENDPALPSPVGCARCAAAARALGGVAARWRCARLLRAQRGHHGAVRPRQGHAPEEGAALPAAHVRYRDGQAGSASGPAALDGSRRREDDAPLHRCR
jgi:integrase